MKNNEILIIQYPYRMRQQSVDALRERILKQKEEGVILLSDFCTVVAKPEDVDVRVEVEKEDEPTLWLLVDDKSNLFCDECGITIKHWDNYFSCCPYCGKKHTFGKEE